MTPDEFLAHVGLPLPNASAGVRRRTASLLHADYARGWACNTPVDGWDLRQTVLGTSRAALRGMLDRSLGRPCAEVEWDAPKEAPE
jgi:hypothetical protein